MYKNLLNTINSVNNNNYSNNNNSKTNGQSYYTNNTDNSSITTSPTSSIATKNALCKQSPTSPVSQKNHVEDPLLLNEATSLLSTGHQIDFERILAVLVQTANSSSNASLERLLVAKLNKFTDLLEKNLVLTIELNEVTQTLYFKVLNASLNNNWSYLKLSSKIFLCLNETIRSE